MEVAKRAVTSPDITSLDFSVGFFLKRNETTLFTVQLMIYSVFAASTALK